MTEPRTRRQRDGLIIGMGTLALICTFVTIAMAYTTLHNRSQLLDQAKGRRVAIGVTCGATSAIIEAGRSIITGESQGALPKSAEKALRALGFPPRKQRRHQALLAAKAYAKSISDAIEKQSGVKGIVRRNGSLNCDLYQRIAKTQ
jgi:hypothetical protein